MKRINSKAILVISAYYVVLLSGIVFYGMPLNGKMSFSALVMYIAGAFAALLAVNACVKIASGTAPQTNGAIKGIFCITGFFIWCAVFGVYARHFSNFITEISPDYGGAVFSHFFVLLTVLAALYMGKRTCASFCRLCILFLPLIVFPYVITWFDFLKYQPINVSSLLPGFSLMPDADSFFSGFACASGILPLAWELNKNKDGKELMRETGIAFALFAVTVVLEAVKCILWFGAAGLEYVSRPDMIMLASVPFMNVQEVFLFSYFFAFALKACVFCTSARILVQSVPAKRRFPPWVYYGISACAAYVFFSADAKVAEWALEAVFFIGIIVYYLPAKNKKTQKRIQNK